jgi:hypothetical protein
MRVLSQQDVPANFKKTDSVYFRQCVNIKEVHFPNPVSIGDMNAGNPNLYFRQNEGLKRIEIGVKGTFCSEGRDAYCAALWSNDNRIH